MFFKTILALFRKNKLTFIERKEETGDVVTFYFKGDETTTWLPGQHGVFSPNHVKIKKSTRAFSIASTQEEGQVMISMKVPSNPSEFKQTFLSLQPGDTVTMRGPIGDFSIKDPNQPVVFIAGGIGITPFRALLMDWIKNKRNPEQNVQVLYSEASGNHVYRDELDKICLENPTIQIHYVSGREELTKAVEHYTGEYKNGANYFITGPVSMVKNLKNTLKAQGISSKSIKTDLFVGYK